MNLNPMEQFAIKPIVPLHLPAALGGYDVSFTNQSLLMVIVVLAAALFLTLAVKPGRLVPTRGQSMAETSYEFVANMIHSASGEDGLKFFPFVFTLFIFVLFSNFFGLVPGSFTVTSQIAVTFALAAFIILMVIVTGFIQHGLGFLKLFVPKAPDLICWSCWCRSRSLRSSPARSAFRCVCSPTCWPATPCCRCLRASSSRWAARAES